MRRGLREWLVLAIVGVAVFAILASFGWIGPNATGTLHKDYLLGRLLIVAIYALLALGLSVEMGYAGLLNLGHVAFMAVGGYTVAIFSTWYTTKDGGAHDLRPALAGTTAWGVVTCLFAALLLALLVYVPTLLVLQRVARGRGTRWPLVGAAAAALAVGAYGFLGMFPLTLDGATNMVVLLGLVLGIVLAAVGGAALGLTGLRLRDDHLAIVTLGAAESLRLVISNEDQLTNGTQGISSLPDPIFSWETKTQWFQDLSSAWGVKPFYLGIALVAVASVVLAFVLLETLARAPWGRVLKAIREDEEVASALGKNTLLYKIEALMIGSGLAAFAGALYVWNLGSAYPDHFQSAITFYAFAILILGGVGNHKGAILGAIILWGILEFASNLTFLQAYKIQFAGPLQSIFVGLVLILVVMLRPQGAIGSKEEMALDR